MAGRALLVCVLCVLCCAAGGGWAWDHLCPADGKEQLNVTEDGGWKFCAYNETLAAATKQKRAAAAASASTINPAGAGAGASTAVGGNGQAVGSAGGAVGGTVPVADVSDGNSRGTDVQGPSQRHLHPLLKCCPHLKPERELGRRRAPPKMRQKSKRKEKQLHYPKVPERISRLKVQSNHLRTLLPPLLRACLPSSAG
ncbi:uncharacterized protein Tco025E_09268 [Trypanosoma conorhini]|uniref:Mucin-associated surface protein (MASP) n=1 Tax=Trypanosoma conorhini TaxID=83891 RepID=A0A3R7N120_9TRYP|nr:uncharacterized protein Tco025E_09268 [Trypanosoma conorhini]RNE98255.1 hypothetical protein Tco025E_09268 [Trypanosoma conorhini]